MDQSTLVSTLATPGQRHSPCILVSTRSSIVKQRRASPFNVRVFAHPNRMEVVWEQFIQRGFPNSVVKLLFVSTRDATTIAYQSAWKSWCNCCSQRCSNPLPCDLHIVLEYLAYLSHYGKAYFTIYIHRSMLSVTLPSIDGFPLGKIPLVKQLMKGCFNYHPPAPKYSSMWDPDVLPQLMTQSGDKSSLNFKILSRKVMNSLALALLLRVSKIASIDRESVHFLRSGVTFSFQASKIAKIGSPSIFLS